MEEERRSSAFQNFGKRAGLASSERAKARTAPGGKLLAGDLPARSSEWRGRRRGEGRTSTGLRYLWGCKYGTTHAKPESFGGTAPQGRTKTGHPQPTGPSKVAVHGRARGRSRSGLLRALKLGTLVGSGVLAFRSRPPSNFVGCAWEQSCQQVGCTFAFSFCSRDYFAGHEPFSSQDCTHFCAQLAGRHGGVGRRRHWELMLMPKHTQTCILQEQRSGLQSGSDTPRGMLAVLTSTNDWRLKLGFLFSVGDGGGSFLQPRW